MAKSVRITLSIGMVNALKKQLRIENCPLCGYDLSEHRWIEIIQSTKEIAACSNS